MKTLTGGDRQHGFDDVNGICIGGDHVSWRLVYDGRLQTIYKQFAIDEGDAVARAGAMIYELTEQNPLVYTDSSLWTIQIYEG